MNNEFCYGIISIYHEDKGYGWIGKPKRVFKHSNTMGMWGERDTFFHITDFLDETPIEGKAVVFKIGYGRKGLCAKEVTYDGAQEAIDKKNTKDEMKFQALAIENIINNNPCKSWTKEWHMFRDFMFEQGLARNTIDNYSFAKSNGGVCSSNAETYWRSFRNKIINEYK